jgi:hypothetical protein
MNAAPKKRPGVLRLLPVLLVPIVFMTGVWTLRPPVIVVTVATAVVVTFMMVYANYVSFSFMRRLDEVQNAGAAFAARWGGAAGQAAFLLLLVLPPFKDFATAAISAFVAKFVIHPNFTVDQTVVVLSLAFGFVVLVVLQSIGAMVAHTLWWTAKR